MAQITRRKFVLKSHFHGLPKKENLSLEEETLPPIKDGEFLCEAEWLSVDPYMRSFGEQLNLGDTMMGEQVAKVTESKAEGFSVGDYVIGQAGWVDKSVGTSATFKKLDSSIPEDLHSAGLGMLGMPGATAYLGFLEICQPKAGDTLVVTGAAGAVGSVVGQIAKIKGCRVVGFAGSDAKVEYLKSLGFDAAYNYKTITSLDATLKEACPKGIDLFFDNVGGQMLMTILTHMTDFGKVALCGAISEYNLKEPLYVETKMRYITLKQLKVEGFISNRWLPRWPEAFKKLAEWIKEGKLKNNETVTNGFEKMADAFVSLFQGHENLGKAVVKA